jgi:tetratricopeptide (TPR) repeat protein
VRWVLPTLLLFCLPEPALLAGPTTLVRSAAQPGDPDRLYADREHLPSARQAAAIWEARLTNDPRDFEAAWKLARACYWLGGHVPAEERRRHYERGIDAGRRAIDIDSTRPEGHFWMAADMGAMAESFGVRAGLKYRSPVKRALETVLATAPAYQEGSADRALGRWYLKVPGILGGSRSQSVEHLRRSLTYDPTSAASHFFLFETYLAMGRKDDARESLQRVLDAPEPPGWEPEVREFKQKARMELARIR